MDRSTSYSSLREHLKEEMDQICSNHEVLEVRRHNGKNIIMMSEADYTSMQETFYLMSSIKNHNKILDALNRTGGKSYDDIKKKYPI